ncbi:hypothetical protein RFI_37350, partial [Reticulomyxa filosa]
KANGIFVEQPAGICNLCIFVVVVVDNYVWVGFSYAENPAETGDSQAAIDNYNFIRGWLQTFTNYQTNNFYITSESYGGHYMPTLAKQIVEGNDQGNTPQINFKGLFFYYCYYDITSAICIWCVFVGNPYTDPNENAKGMYDTWYGHQLVSYPSWYQWYLKCDDGDTGGAACDEALTTLNEEVDGLDPYALDYPVCNNVLNQLSDRGITFDKSRFCIYYVFVVDDGGNCNRYWFLKKVVRDMLGRPLPKQYEQIAQKHDDYSAKISTMTKEEQTKALKSGEFPDPSYEQCAQAYATEYLNRPDVQEAIHVEQHVIWTDCSDTLNYNRSDGSNPMEPIWQWLVSNSNLRMTIVSGDDDSVCGMFIIISFDKTVFFKKSGTIGTQSWIWNLGYPAYPKVNWQAWQVNNQVAGYYTAFNTSTQASFCFVTVHSAGHMIPQTQPERSLAAFSIVFENLNNNIQTLVFISISLNNEIKA